VGITVLFDNGLDEEIAAVRADLEHAERAQRDAAARSRRLALLLREAGLSGADIAVVLRVSPQRVSQLVKAAAV
jgi:septal ring factor EnvC (AmiA/AmiB activator)